MDTVRTTFASRVAALSHIALVVCVGVGLLVIPNVYSYRTWDSFRLPKESAFRVLAIVSALLVSVAVLYGGTHRLREMVRRRAVSMVVAGSVAWTLLSTLTSVNRIQSLPSLVTVLCAAALFVATWYVAPRLSSDVLLLLVPAVSLTTLTVALQQRGTWSPLEVDIRGSERLGLTAFIGNPNDVGAYLAVAAVLLGSLAAQWHGWRRWVSWAGALISMAGIAVTTTLTAAVAAVIASAVLLARWSMRALVTAVVLVAVCIGAALFTGVARDLPIVERVSALPSMIRSGNWGQVLSNRLPPFLAAVEMFRERPLTGVGPGAYKTEEMTYTVRASRRYPSEVAQSIGVNFGETHNDHLQLLAETGLPGYVLFLAALVLLLKTARTDVSTPGARAAGSIAIPLVIVTVLLGLASFPLQIAVTRHLLLVAGALVVGWSES